MFDIKPDNNFYLVSKSGQQKRHEDVLLANVFHEPTLD